MSAVHSTNSYPYLPSLLTPTSPTPDPSNVVVPVIIDASSTFPTYGSVDPSFFGGGGSGGVSLPSPQTAAGFVVMKNATGGDSECVGGVSGGVGWLSNTTAGASLNAATSVSNGNGTLVCGFSSDTVGTPQIVQAYTTVSGQITSAPTNPNVAIMCADKTVDGQWQGLQLPSGGSGSVDYQLPLVAQYDTNGDVLGVAWGPDIHGYQGVSHPTTFGVVKWDTQAQTDNKYSSTPFTDEKDFMNGLGVMSKAVRPHSNSVSVPVGVLTHDSVNSVSSAFASTDPNLKQLVAVDPAGIVTGSASCDPLQTNYYLGGDLTFHQLPGGLDQPVPQLAMSLVATTSSTGSATTAIGGVTDVTGAYWNDTASGAAVLDTTGAPAGSYLSKDGTWTVPTTVATELTLGLATVPSGTTYLAQFDVASGNAAAKGILGATNGSLLKVSNTGAATTVDFTAVASTNFLNEDGTFAVPTELQLGPAAALGGTTYLAQFDANTGDAAANAILGGLDGSLLKVSHTGIATAIDLSGATANKYLLDTGAFTQIAPEQISTFAQFGVTGNYGPQYIASLAAIGGASAVYVDPLTGKLCDNVSAARYKENITSLSEADASAVFKLKPVRYNLKADEQKRAALGLIAEETNELFPEATRYNAEGQIHTIDYSSFVAPLIAAVQQLDRKMRKRCRDWDDEEEEASIRQRKE